MSSSSIEFQKENHESLNKITFEIRIVCIDHCAAKIKNIDPEKQIL